MNLSQENTSTDLTSVKSSNKTVHIPAGQTTQVPCGVNTGSLANITLALFQLQVKDSLLTGLQVHEVSLGNHWTKE